jgi:hypothetical protein
VTCKLYFTLLVKFYDALLPREKMPLESCCISKFPKFSKLQFENHKQRGSFLSSRLGSQPDVLQSPAILFDMQTAARRLDSEWAASILAAALSHESSSSPQERRLSGSWSDPQGLVAPVSQNLVRGAGIRGGSSDRTQGCSGRRPTLDPLMLGFSVLTERVVRRSAAVFTANAYLHSCTGVATGSLPTGVGVAPDRFQTCVGP